MLTTDYDDSGFNSEVEEKGFAEDSRADNIPLTPVRPDGKEDAYLALMKLAYNQLVITNRLLARIAESLESSGRSQLLSAVTTLENEGNFCSIKLIYRV